LWLGNGLHYGHTRGMGVSVAANPFFFVSRVPDIKFDIEQFRNCDALRNPNMELTNLIETMRRGGDGDGPRSCWQRARPSKNLDEQTAKPNCRSRTVPFSFERTKKPPGVSAFRPRVSRPLATNETQAATEAFRFLRQPSRPNAPKPVAKSGSAAGNGIKYAPWGSSKPKLYETAPASAL
jgi:hypothetical protein